MDSAMIDERFDQIDRRLERVDDKLDHVEQRLERVEYRLESVEQILQHDITPRLVHVEQILPTLATKDELGDLRRHMTMLFEHRDDKISLLAEHLLAIKNKLGV